MASQLDPTILVAGQLPASSALQCVAKDSTEWESTHENSMDPVVFSARGPPLPRRLRTPHIGPPQIRRLIDSELVRLRRRQVHGFLSPAVRDALQTTPWLVE